MVPSPVDTEALMPLVPGSIWHARQALRLGPVHVKTRVTCVKLADGSLWVHSPIAPTAALVSEVQRIGTVRYVIAPNKSHHLFFASFLQAFPDAQGYLAPGLGKKRPALSGYPELEPGKPAPWDSELTAFFIEGLPALNETVWFHPASRTLILTDLLFCFGAESSWAGRLLASLLGVYEHLAMSRTLKLLVRDRKALSRSADRLLALEVRRIVLAHDQVIEARAQSRLAAALGWLR